MKTLATLLLLATTATSSFAATVWNEAVNGDLSNNPGAPTPLVFAIGANTVIGTTGNANAGERDYITFTILPGQTLTAINLNLWVPNNLGFLAINEGATSYIPSIATDANFLSGIHVASANVGTNLLIDFATNNVTTNALPAPLLEAGTYSFLIQQTSILTEQYSLDFVIDAPVPAGAPTWGAIKQLYR